jgi:hypothetical protein
VEIFLEVPPSQAGATPTANPNVESDENLRILCRAELEHYLSDGKAGACPLHDDEKNFNNPLKWWKKNMHRLHSSLAYILRNHCNFCSI